MFKIPKPEYTAEFKQLAVERVMDGQRFGAVAKDLGLNVKANECVRSCIIALSRVLDHGRTRRWRRLTDWV